LELPRLGCGNKLQRKKLFSFAILEIMDKLEIVAIMTTGDIKAELQIYMKLLVTGLIALSMVGYSRADGIGSGFGFGVGMAIANKVFSGGQPRQRERVVEHEHRTVIHERTIVHDKPAPAQQSTTVIVNNNLPAQPAAQPTSVTTVNAKTIAVTNPPAQIAPSAAIAPAVLPSAEKTMENDVNVN
jgi:hypothetical protein